jgi:hypothetical protein
MILFTLIVVVYCFIRIHLEIKHVAQTSRNKHTLEIHRQVMQVLMIQAVIPVLTIIVPLLIMMVFLILRISFPMLGLYTLVSIQWATSIKVSNRNFCKKIEF